MTSLKSQIDLLKSILDELGIRESNGVTIPEWDKYIDLVSRSETLDENIETILSRIRATCIKQQSVEVSFNTTLV